MSARGLAAIGVTLLAVWPTLLIAGFPPEMEQKLGTADLIYVATERKAGGRGEAAPVWCGMIEGQLYINTGASSTKAKRVKRGSPFFVGLEKDGPFVEATGEVITDPKLIESLGEVYAKKYWIAWLGLFRPRASRVADGKSVVIRLVPKER